MISQTSGKRFVIHVLQAVTIPLSGLLQLVAGECILQFAQQVPQELIAMRQLEATGLLQFFQTDRAKVKWLRQGLLNGLAFIHSTAEVEAVAKPKNVAGLVCDDLEHKNPT